MSDDDLGPRPEPTAEAPQLVPGGADAADDPRYGTSFEEPTTPDLRPEANPAVEDVVPDEVTAPDDKQQEPDDAGEQSPPGEGHSEDGDGTTASEPTD